jgi:hypothetical protein
MAEQTSGYNYRVLALAAPGTIGESDFPGIYDLGWHRGRTPTAAVEAACEANGLPETATGTVVAVAERQWNERQAKKQMVPIWEIVEVTEENGAAADPRVPPAAGDDLADGLDPERGCEWTEDGLTCEHLPGDHGEHGLGMCRVENCPCGGYEPKP